MSFEFVHVTSSNPRQDAAASTRVRVQAMRDFRQRQDEQRRRSRSTPILSSESRRRRSPFPNPISSSYPPRDNNGELAFQIPDPMLSQMQHIIEAHRSWIMSYNSQQLVRVVNVATAPWRYPTSPILMNAQCLEAIGHLNATNYLPLACTDTQCTRIKLQLLRLANERVADPEAAHHDEMVAALASLASFEVGLSCLS